MSSKSAEDAAAGSSALEEADKYDYIVIGGGSGGLASAKAAANKGAKTLLFDYVKPTIHGTTWKLGGTCVNVGCIPKKLMHYSALLKQSFADARALGWDVSEDTPFNWPRMAKTVQNYVRSLNWGYRSALIDKSVKYINAYAQFADANTLSYEIKGSKKRVTAPHILLAMGGRPSVPDIPGKELAKTSDDLFWLKESPGKTLFVGASYISLECAGFLHEMGLEVAVMVRSILLRGMDRECSEHVGVCMEKMGMRFIKQCVPTRLEKTESGRIKVYYQSSSSSAAASSSSADASSGSDGDSKMSETEEFDTVFFATGRKPMVSDMCLDKAGLVQNENGKFDCNNEVTNVPNIYAVGDIVNGAPELTPVAIQAGKLLAQRLFGGSTVKMDYIFVPTTVFTPVEYSFCGYSEDEAMDVFGEEDLEVYHQRATSLEWDGVHRAGQDGSSMANHHICKVICQKSKGEKIVGFHYCGPNAGEVMQGYALALKMGVTKADLDNVIGIHPTTAEWFTTLTITKSSGVSADATGC